MTPDLEQILISLSALPRSDRAEVVDHLIVTLDSEDDDEVAGQWVAEINRRVQQILTGEVRARPAEQVFADLRARRA